MHAALRFLRRIVIIEGFIFGGVAVASLVLGFSGFHGWSNAFFVVGAVVTSIAGMAFAGGSGGVTRMASGRFGPPIVRDAYFQSMSTMKGGITGGMAEIMRRDKLSGGFSMGYPAAFLGAGIIALIIAAIFASI